MKEFIDKLPLDIVYLIIPYTYQIQNKSLLSDITNYTKIKTILIEKYYQCWIGERESIDPEEHKNWLINDIFAYANNYNATMYGYIDQFYSIFSRNQFLQSNKKIDKYVNHLEGKTVSTQINIFLGLLTIKERNDVLSNFHRLNY
jgi:hypothetical protein